MANELFISRYRFFFFILNTYPAIKSKMSVCLPTNVWTFYMAIELMIVDHELYGLDRERSEKFMVCLGLSGGMHTFGSLLVVP